MPHNLYQRLPEKSEHDVSQTSTGSPSHSISLIESASGVDIDSSYSHRRHHTGSPGRQNNSDNDIRYISFLKNIHLILNKTLTSVPDQLVFVVWIPLLLAAYIVSGYYLMMQPGKIYAALISQSQTDFTSKLIWLVLFSTLTTFLKASLAYSIDSLGNNIRATLTNLLHNLYFMTPKPNKSPGYYQISSHQNIDNPDQRCTTDLKNFVSSLLTFIYGDPCYGALGLIESSFSLLFYSFQTWARLGYVGILVAYVWSILVALTSSVLIKYSANAVYQQEVTEANFRKHHLQIRSSAHDIAFTAGSHFEKHLLQSAFQNVYSSMQTVIKLHFYQNTVQMGFSYYVNIVMYASIAWVVFTDSGDFYSNPSEKTQFIAQTGAVFISLLYAFTSIIQLGKKLSDLMAYEKRVSSLYIFLKSHHETTVHEDEIIIDSDVISIRDLKISLPGQTSPVEILSHNLNFDLDLNDWLLITGKSGCGKTSFGRVLRGLSPPTHGSIRRPKYTIGEVGDDAEQSSERKTIMFLSQEVYMPNDTDWKSQITYPTIAKTVDAKRIKEVTVKAGLQNILDRIDNNLDAIQDWHSILSGGEKQKLAFARLFWHRPSFVFIDEGTCSLDIKSQETLLGILKTLDVGVINVGHKEVLKIYHNKVLDFSLT